jgi:hypothetical protein
VLHCSQCGKAIPDGSSACPDCGLAVPDVTPRVGRDALSARTMIGGMGRLVLDPAVAPQGAGEAPRDDAEASGVSHRTIVGLATPKGLLNASKLAPSSSARTLVGGAGAPLAGPGVEGRLVADPNRTLPHGTPDGSVRTLLGVARPGIAPLAPGEDRETPYDDGDYEPASELGATVNAAIGRHVLPPPVMRDELRKRIDRRVPHVRSRKRRSRRPLIIVAIAGGLCLTAVLFAVLWPSAPPLRARARADAQGREGVEVRCASCPDGTKLSVGTASAVVKDQVASIPLPTALSVGENRLRVAIDRPGKGRDETVHVMVNVAYRIRPDLGTLQGERPSIQIVAEAARGTTIALDGKPMQLSGGRGAETIDVTDACTGLADDSKTLARQIPYVVTPAEGPPESGVVSVSVGIVPLRIDAPGARVTIDSASFVLAGHTMKGAEVLAAGRPITVKPDGSFAQVMNVSSVGATQIEVRAKVAGMAPRLSLIKVRRVDSLDAVARDFAADKPLSYAALASDIAGSVGKPVVLGGEVIETRRQGYQTILLLDVAPSFGCASAGGKTCAVRLVHGAENSAKKGDVLRAYGRVTRAFTAAGGKPQSEVPEVEVEFTMKGLK